MNMCFNRVISGYRHVLSMILWDFIEYYPNVMLNLQLYHGNHNVIVSHSRHNNDKPSTMWILTDMNRCLVLTEDQRKPSK